MKKILVTVDVDGVIFPIEDGTELDGARFRTNGFDVILTGFAAWVLNMLAESDVDVVWASSWGDAVSALNADSGGVIPEFPTLSPSSSSAKPEVIADAVIAGDYDVVVVIDDDRRVSAGVRNKLRARSASATVKSVIPEKNLGVTAVDVTKVMKAVK